MMRALRAVPLREARRRLRESFWFVPLLMLCGAALLAWGTLRLDGHLGTSAFELEALDWVRLGGHAGSRTMLAALAGAVMTVAGVVFSVTMAVLALTTSQFGPRLLRRFVSDRGIQAVLGTFLATFLHSVLILLAIGDEGQLLPRVSVLTSTTLTLASLLAFVYFVHHVATQVQADRVIAAAAKDLDDVIEGVHLRRSDDRLACRAGLPGGFEDDARPVPARREGYVTALDLERLIRYAREHDAVIRVDAAPGAFVAVGDAIASVFPPSRAPALEPLVRRAFYFGSLRTPEQDLEFAIEQLVEIGVRAMSPGINDPFSAIRCVDRLEASLGRLFERAPPPSHCGDEQGDLRVVVPWASVVESVAAAFGPLRHAGRQEVLVLRTIARAIGRLAVRAPTPEVARALRDELRGVEEAVEALTPSDQVRIRPEVVKVAERLDRRAAQLVT